jgi:hypothetical protein
MASLCELYWLTVPTNPAFVSCVCRQSIWFQRQGKLSAFLAHLIGPIMPRICGIEGLMEFKETKTLAAGKVVKIVNEGFFRDIERL